MLEYRSISSHGTTSVAKVVLLRGGAPRAVAVVARARILSRRVRIPLP
jgi:hypothetical protein